ncbi:MAG: type I restriction-modification enzyme R subunit C-terminal domain-containing protein [Phycisphaerae bacterium]|jgi:type I restriction enzyme R subunit
MAYIDKGPEAKTRHEIINPMLKASGWIVQHFKVANVYGSKGVAVEYFPMGTGVGEADYVLFVNGEACGIIEAKQEGETLTGKEPQSNRYASGFPKDFRYADLPLPFVYESSGSETRFTNLWDPKPRSRELFWFHKPEIIEEWLKEGKKTLRHRLTEMPASFNPLLWEIQKKAIQSLEGSLALARPRALIQMATGSGKTFTAVNACYRLIRHSNAKRILFLVDRGNLGEQTLQEFQNFVVPKDGRKFTDIYNVQHLESNVIDDVSRVCISTIQRIYSMLKGEKQLDPLCEQKSGFEDDFNLEPAPVKYNPHIPISMFDIIIIDECHRSIYNLWKQVLDYFDAFLVGLTATPSKSTIAFFNKNLVMEYSHEEAVAHNINVDFSVYDIRTKITKAGSIIPKGEIVQKRDKRTRRKKWEMLEDEVDYKAEQLDRDVVSKDQIRTIIRAFKEKVRSEIFPGRKNVPKTLIYAKDDNHAEEIVQIAREEFDEGNDFAVKITYKTEGQKPEDLIRQFRNDFYPRIAVTVDMIATGTDIKPLEIVFFMRAVRSRNYFEQMKGRGVRVMRNDDFMAVTPDAVAKERFVIVDAVGVTEIEELNDTQPLEQNPTVSFEKLLKSIRYGRPTKEKLSSIAGRLVRLHKKLTDEQIKEVKKITDGKTLCDFAHDFIIAIDEDRTVEAIKAEKRDTAYEPLKKEIQEVSEKRMIEAIKPFVGNAKLMERLPEIKAETEQIIDDVSVDEVITAGYSPIATEKAKDIIKSFKNFIDKNKNELDALQVFYNSKKKLHWDDLKALAEKIKTPPYLLTPVKIWQAYKQVESEKVHGRTANKIADFISLLKFELGKSNELEPFADTIDKKFSRWLSEQRAKNIEFTQEQLNWLEKMKNHIAESVELTSDDFEYAPFDQMGGLGKANKVFGSKFNELIEQLTEKLVA